MTSKELIQKCECFSISLNEFTNCTDTAQLEIFNRGVDSNFQYCEKWLALQSMKGTTKEEDIYKELKTVFKEYEIHDRI